MARAPRLQRRAVLSAGASALAMPFILRPAVAIEPYQAVWDADLEADGLPALPLGQRGRDETGYVLVDERGDGVDHRLIAEVHLPAGKRPGYAAFKALMDNYHADGFDGETITADEARETLSFIDYCVDHPALAAVARFAEIESGQRLSRDALRELVFTIWFKPFALGRKEGLSGFEHVMLGEQSGRDELGGQHFWYGYYLYDSVILGADRIDFAGYRYGRDDALERAGRATPQVGTLAYAWFAPDGAGGRTRLFQEIGGFWIGPSPAGMIALGTLRYLQGGEGERPATIHGVRYDVVLHTSPDDSAIRTVFPIFRGTA